MDNNIDRATMEGGREIRYRDALNIDSRLSVGGDFSFPFNSEFNTAFPISPVTSGGGGATTVLPFIVTKATGSNVTVATGQVNSLTYTSATFSIASDGDKVYIDITVNASGIASAVTVSTAASVPSDTSTHAYLQIAIVEKDGSDVSEITNTRSGGSLGHAYAGGTIHTLWQV
jgi:hypothetical protein